MAKRKAGKKITYNRQRSKARRAAGVAAAAYGAQFLAGVPIRKAFKSGNYAPIMAGVYTQRAGAAIGLGALAAGASAVAISRYSKLGTMKNKRITSRAPMPKKSYRGRQRRTKRNSRGQYAGSY